MDATLAPSARGADNLLSSSVPGVMAVGPARWRITDPSGLVRGHVEARAVPGGTRYAALRFHQPSHAFRTLGDFWNVAEAVECVRLSR